MKKIVVSEYVSLDGVMEEPRWTVPYTDADVLKFKYDELFSSDTLLLGRVTYEGFAEAWPNMQRDPQGFADRMNSLPKYVASNTLSEMKWNATPIKGDIKVAVNKIKQGDGQNLLVYGSSNFVGTLKELDLVDQYNLLVYPVVLGGGKPAFVPADKQMNLKLVRTQTFPSGVVALIYEPDRSK